MPLASRYALASAIGVVEQADGLDVGLNGEHHIHDGLGVQRVGRAGDIVDVGQVCGGGVGDGRVDDRGLGGLGGGGHALGGQRRDGNDGVIAVGDDLCEVLVLDRDALLGGLGVQLFLNSHADLVEAGVVELLDNGDLVAVSGGGVRGALGSGRGGLGGRCGSVSGIGGVAAGGQAGHHGGGGQNSNKLFHGKFSLICKL